MKKGHRFIRCDGTRPDVQGTSGSGNVLGARIRVVGPRGPILAEGI